MVPGKYRRADARGILGKDEGDIPRPKFAPFLVENR